MVRRRRCVARPLFYCVHELTFFAFRGDMICCVWKVHGRLHGMLERVCRVGDAVERGGRELQVAFKRGWRGV